MHSQSQIKRTLSTTLAIAYVAGLLDSGEFIHRSELADFVCEQCGFQDARGHAQRDGCLKAPRELEASGHFALPAAQAKTGPNTPKRLTEAVADPVGVPAQAGEVPTESLPPRIVRSISQGAINRARTREHALIHAHYQGAYWEGAYGWGFQNDRGAGLWGDHEQVLFWVKGQYLLVLDAMTADPGVEIRNGWQLAPLKWSCDPSTFAWWSEEPGTNLSLQLIAPPGGAVMECRDGMVGYNENVVPAPLVEFRYRQSGSAPTVSAVLLAAYSGRARPKFTIRGDTDLSCGAIHHLEVGLPDGSVDQIAWTTGLVLPVDDGRPFTTDATFVRQRGSRKFSLSP